jgi:hypothetical protein
MTGGTGWHVLYGMLTWVIGNTIANQGIGNLVFTRLT